MDIEEPEDIEDADDPTDTVLHLLVRLADAADRLSLPAFRAGDPEITIKADGSPVTATDLAVEQAIQALVAMAHPDDGFLGEEVGDHPGPLEGPARRWIVDGIDGTSLFTTARPEWSTLIALEVDGRLEAGMVTSPALRRRWYTTPSGGPHTVGIGDDGSPERLAVSPVDDLSAARVARWPAAGVVRPGFEARSERLAALTASLAPFERPIDRPVPHGALLVADGRADAFVHLGGQPWDHAASAAIVAAAGGRFTDLDGLASIDGGAGIYSNGRIHDAVVAAMAL